MDFPRIETLSDVAPHVSYERGFVVARRGDHTVVDYVHTVSDTFTDAISLECRGLKFDRDGRLIGRPFHKFFNLGERQPVEAVDWSAPHRIHAKLDGSMIHPVLLDGALRFMTRMGETEQSARALRHAGAPEFDISRHLVEAGITPIFEFTAPENRIVLAYDRPQWTLLAAREMVSGLYLPHGEIERLAGRFGVALVEDHGTVDDAAAFVARVRAATGIEGYVLAFEDGHRLKLKTEAYVLRHKALSLVAFEKNVLGWICAGSVDDIVPLLPEAVADRVLDYRDQIGRGVAARAAEIEGFVAAHRDLPRKEFAARAVAMFDPRLRGLAFSVLDGKDGRTLLLDLLAAASQSEPRVSAVRDLFGMHWSLQGLSLPDLEA